jgi:hypothetical protein
MTGLVGNARAPGRGLDRRRVAETQTRIALLPSIAATQGVPAPAVALRGWLAIDAEAIAPDQLTSGGMGAKWVQNLRQR